MAKFAMYVIDFEEGTCVGTNDTEDLNVLLDADRTGERYGIIHSTYGNFHINRQPSYDIEKLDVEHANDPDDEDEEE